jgi:hypothetical protein
MKINARSFCKKIIHASPLQSTTHIWPISDFSSSFGLTVINGCRDPLFGLATRPCTVTYIHGTFGCNPRRQSREASRLEMSKVSWWDLTSRPASQFRQLGLKDHRNWLPPNKIFLLWKYVKTAEYGALIRWPYCTNSISNHFSSDNSNTRGGLQWVISWIFRATERDIYRRKLSELNFTYVNFVLIFLYSHIL